MLLKFLVHILMQHHLIVVFLMLFLNFHIHFHLLDIIHNIPLVLLFCILEVALPQDFLWLLLYLLHVCLLNFLCLQQYIQLLLLVFLELAYIVLVQNTQLLQLWMFFLLPLVLFHHLFLLFHLQLLHMLPHLYNYHSMNQILNILF